MMKRTLKKSLKWIIILGIISTAGYLGYTKFFKGKEAAELPPETMQVISFPVTEETLTSSIQVKGRSQYQQETLVYAPFASKVTAWKVENGAQVKKGDVLLPWIRVHSAMRLRRQKLPTAKRSWRRS